MPVLQIVSAVLVIVTWAVGASAYQSWSQPSFLTLALAVPLLLVLLSRRWPVPAGVLLLGLVGFLGVAFWDDVDSYDDRKVRLLMVGLGLVVVNAAVVLAIALSATHKTTGKAGRLASGAFLMILAILFGFGGYFLLRVGGILNAAGGFGLFSLAAMTWRLATRLRQPGAQELLQADRRPPVFLLRAFHTDETAHPTRYRLTQALMFHPDFWRSKALQTLEQALARIVQPYGPFIAIGRPGESVPPLGAARFYVEDWQAAVRSVAESSRLVILVAGQTPGVLWELDHLLGTTTRDRLVIVFPPGTDPAAWWAAVMKSPFPGARGEHVIAVGFSRDRRPVILANDEEGLARAIPALLDGTEHSATQQLPAFLA